MYKDTPQFRLQMYRQYSKDYGELSSEGDYQLNDQVRFYDGHAKGTITWKYVIRNRGLVYVLEDYSGVHFQVMAHEIVGMA